MNYYETAVFSLFRSRWQQRPEPDPVSPTDSVAAPVDDPLTRPRRSQSQSQTRQRGAPLRQVNIGGVNYPAPAVLPGLFASPPPRAPLPTASNSRNGLPGPSHSFHNHHPAASSQPGIRIGHKPRRLQQSGK